MLRTVGNVPNGSAKRRGRIDHMKIGEIPFANFTVPAARNEPVSTNPLHAANALRRGRMRRNDGRNVEIGILEMDKKSVRL